MARSLDSPVMEWVRRATGSAVVITDPRGDVLLMRRAYPPFDWVLPGGGAEAHESPSETALREVREELGLQVELRTLTGVYYQADHPAGEVLHFVFTAVLPPDAELTPCPGEVAEIGLLRPDVLPEPMSPSTGRRLLEALAERPQPLPVTLDPASEPGFGR